MSTTETASPTKTACAYGTADPDWCRLNHRHGAKRPSKRSAATSELTTVSFDASEISGRVFGQYAEAGAVAPVELVRPGAGGVWADVDARTAAMRAEGEALLAAQ